MREFMDLACALGGPNPALPPNSAFSQAHFDKVSTDPDLTSLAQYDVLFVDSLTALSRLSFTHCEQLPEAVTDRGRKDTRAIYGAHARHMLGTLNHLQHARKRTIVFVAILERVTDDFNVASWQPQLEGAKTGRELPGIVDEVITMNWIDFGDGKPPTRAFVCTVTNPWGYPAKDRSGRARSARAAGSRQTPRETHPPSNRENVNPDRFLWTTAQRPDPAQDDRARADERHVRRRERWRATDTKDRAAEMLKTEFTFLEGEYAKRKIFGNCSSSARPKARSKWPSVTAGCSKASLQALDTSTRTTSRPKRAPNSR